MGAAAMALALAAPAAAGAGSDRPALLALLHDGRFAAGGEMLRRDGSASRVEALFFDAFTTYWRLIFDDDNTALQTELETKLDATIAAADDQGEAAEAPLWGGLAHLLMAELEASQRKPLSAAFEAKKAKKLLESQALTDQAKVDAYFGLGTFNYVADTVPSYVKGLRAILFLPKGNRVVGLNQLAAAAARSRFFTLEARTLLVTIYANKHERLYARALDERDRLLSSFPDTIAALYAGARLDLSLGRNEAALARLTRAEDRARTLGDVDPVVVGNILLLAARAEWGALRPDRAEAVAGRALSAGSALGPQLRRDLESLQQAAAARAAGIPWGEATPARFAAMAAAHPEQPLLALLAGDAALQSGKAQEASEWFAKAVKAGVPPEFQAGCQLRQGQAEDLLGRRPEALAIYKVVASAPGFAARDAAYYYQQAPFRLQP